MSAMQTIDKFASALPDWYAFVPPEAKNVRGLWLPRENATKAKRNLSFEAKEGRTGAVVGAPTFQPGYASLKAANNYLLTNVPEMNTMTLCVVAKSSDAGTDNTTRPVFAGNYNGTPTTTGMMLYLTSSGSNLFVRGQACGGDGVAQNRVLNVTTAITSWAFYAYVIDSAINQHIVYDRTNNVATAAGTLTGRTLADRPLEIGSSYSSVFTGNSDIAGVLVADIAASVAQLDAWKVMFNTELAAFGIAV